MVQLGYTPVIRQQSEIAQTLRGGLSDLGRADLNKARMSLEEAAMMHEMNRQKKLDELALPGLQLQSEQAQEQLDFRNKPVRVPDMLKGMYGENPSRETIMHTAASGLFPAILKATGGQIKDGVLTRADGTPVLGKDFQKLAPVIQSFAASSMDYGHGLNQKIRQLETAKEKGGLSPEQEGKLAELKAKKDKPEWLYSQYEKQNDQDLQSIAMLKGMGIEDTSFLEMNIARRNGKMANLAKQAEKADTREFEKYKLKYDRDTKVMLENIKAKAKGEKQTQAEINANNTLRKQHVVGAAQELGMQIQMDEDGNVAAALTKKEVDRLKDLAEKAGVSVYSQATGEKKDRPGWFTGDDELYTVSLVPNYSEKGTNPVERPQASDVDNFIKKQLNRYPDVTNPPVEIRDFDARSHQKSMPKPTPTSAQRKYRPR